MNAHADRSRKLTRRGRQSFRPEMLGLEERVLLSSGRPVAADIATSSLRIPTFTENPGLSVKRVPGFLAGFTDGTAGKAEIEDLAAPFDLANMADREIDSQSVDYWAITLKKDDSVVLTIQLPTGQTDTGFAIRMWNSNGKSIGLTKGLNAAYIAQADGTYIFGISESTNTNYAFNPDATQPAASGTTQKYTAEFQTYPGPNTNPVTILETYKNPAYDASGNWPKFTDDERAAYNVLTHIAASGASANVPSLRNFNSFRNVHETDPGAIKGWLDAAWAPFTALLSPTASPTEIYNSPLYSPQLHAAYTLVS